VATHELSESRRIIARPKTKHGNFDRAIFCVHECVQRFGLVVSASLPDTCARTRVHDGAYRFPDRCSAYANVVIRIDALSGHSDWPAWFVPSSIVVICPQQLGIMHQFISSSLSTGMFKSAFTYVVSALCAGCCSTTVGLTGTTTILLTSHHLNHMRE
jgi:hypothetical protein